MACPDVGSAELGHPGLQFVLHADAGALQGAVDRGFPRVLCQQHDYELYLYRSGLGAGGSGVLRVIAGAASKCAQHRVVDSRHPNGAADRIAARA